MAYAYDTLGGRIGGTTFDSGGNPDIVQHYYYDGNRVIKEEGTSTRRRLVDPSAETPVSRSSALAGG